MAKGGTNYEAAARWASGRLGVLGWELELEIGDDPPAWAGEMEPARIGCCEATVRYRRARVWVSPARCALHGEDPLETLMHEMMHAAAAEAGIANDADDRPEWLWDRIAACLADLYRREMGCRKRSSR